MAWGIVASVGVGLVGAGMASDAAGDAADAQSASAAQSDATQRYQYDTTRADNAPFRETGLQANNQLAALMNSGQFARKFSAADMAADPVYNSGLQFGLNEGTKGINRQAAAGGSMLSGATLKALTRFGNDYGSTKANESYNRFNTDQNSQYNKLAGLSGAGQQATNQVSAAGTNMANNISASQQGVGNARGSAYLSQGNSWQNAINGGVSAFKNSGTNFNSLYGGSGISGGGGFGTGSAFGNEDYGINF